MTQNTEKTKPEEYRGCSRTYAALRHRAISGDSYAIDAFMRVLSDADKRIEAIEASRHESPAAPSGDTTTPPYSVTLTFTPQAYRQLQRLCLYERVIMGFPENLESFIREALSASMSEEGRPEVDDLDEGTEIAIEHFMPRILRPLRE